MVLERHDMKYKTRKKILKSFANLVPHHNARKSFKNYLFNRFGINTEEYKDVFNNLLIYSAAEYDCDAESPNTYANADYHDLPVWQLWLQGKENAPKLVNKCLGSVEKYCGERRIFVLTREDISNYADIPGHIWDKYREGAIGNAHFSDVVRTQLLEKHGGTWIDATVLLTAPIPELFLQQDFFAFAYENAKEAYKMDCYTFGNWFMHAQPNHPLIKKINMALACYWQNENKAVHYFMYHMLATGLINNDQALTRLWRQVPRYTEIPPHVLQKSFLEKYDAQKLDCIKAGSAIHKLSYFTKEQQKMGKYKNTFLDVFLNTDIIA